MKISEIRCHRLTAPLHTPFVTALRRTEHLETTVVEVVADDGTRGYGEAPQVWRVTGESLAGAEACLSGPLADVVRGRDIDDLDDLSREIGEAVVGNFGAKAAMDVALHDLAARRAGQTLAQFLGASSGEHRVETDVTVSAGEPDELAATASKRTAEGFTVLKLKVGTDARDRRGTGARGPRGRARRPHPRRRQPGLDSRRRRSASSARWRTPAWASSSSSSRSSATTSRASQP